MKLFLTTTTLLATIFTLTIFALTFADDCDTRVRLGLCSVTDQPWVTGKGKGVTIVEISGLNNPNMFKTDDRMVIPVSKIGENPTYSATTRTELVVSNENGNATVTVFQGGKKPEMVHTGFDGAVHVAVLRYGAKKGCLHLAVAHWGAGVSYLKRVKGKWYPPITKSLAGLVKTPNGSHPFDSSHAHQIVEDYNGEFLVPDIGKNVVWQLKLNEKAGQIDEKYRLEMKEDDGPRHIVRGKGYNVYLVNEVSLSVVRIRGCDMSNPSKLKECERHVMMNPGEGRTAAAIRISNDYRYLYASVRMPSGTEGSIFVYKLKETGAIGGLVGHYSTQGEHPRDFNIIENGPDCKSYIVVANRDSNSTHIMERDINTGQIGSSLYKVDVPVPVCVNILQTL